MRASCEPHAGMYASMRASCEHHVRTMRALRHPRASLYHHQITATIFAQGIAFGDLLCPGGWCAHCMASVVPMWLVGREDDTRLGPLRQRLPLDSIYTRAIKSELCSTQFCADLRNSAAGGFAHRLALLGQHKFGVSIVQNALEHIMCDLSDIRNSACP
jgi:hypothetical protein